ncbi:unnamed protein product [Adineta steineri]|uniref:Uncharacterized protein n=1 Tax=Adineta steineri TaxID=433720 RepID=A0A814FAU8_9BILA|nr:unnamed protein product [Adineta steineri]
MLIYARITRFIYQQSTNQIILRRQKRDLLSIRRFFVTVIALITRGLPSVILLIISFIRSEEYPLTFRTVWITIIILVLLLFIPELKRIFFKKPSHTRVTSLNIGSISDADNIAVDCNLELGRTTQSSITVGTKRQPKVKSNKRKKIVTDSSIPKRQCTNIENREEIIQTTACTNRTSPTHTNGNSKDLFNQIENHIVLYQDMVTKTLRRMERKLDHHVSYSCTQVRYITAAENTDITVLSFQKSKILDQYRDEKGEVFKNEYMYGDINLLRTSAKDIVDFARRTLKILFSREELQSHILPPARDHLRRPILNEERFSIFLGKTMLYIL